MVSSQDIGQNSDKRPIALRANAVSLCKPEFNQVGPIKSRDAGYFTTSAQEDTWRINPLLLILTA